uniref:Regulatory protein zeste n=1 Tax=Tetranychus urticae TaxID=32264 RepID=T1L2T6_TETUR
MSTTQINGVTFCLNFINRGYCYGLGCKFLHVNRQIENHYRRTGRLPTELANEWRNTQMILARRDPDVCQDQNQSKCFRLNCKFGKHHVFRNDMDAGNVIEFTFRPSPQMINYIENVYQAPKPYWYSDVLCHIRTPFPLLAEHIMKVLKPFRINRNQVSFYYNGTQIQANDSNITPYSLDIGNGVDVIVDVTFEEGSLAELDCAICLSSASERSEGQITVADHSNLANMADDELSDWTIQHLGRPFTRSQEEPPAIVNYLPAGFGVRGKNFTDKEKELLVSLIEDHPKKELTTNRNNDKDTSIAKKNFWCEIAQSFNNASGNETTFNGDQLKVCFKNMVTRAKNAQAENKKETIKTGGGQKESEIGSINSKVINVIGDTIKPYDNQFDSDANVN